MSKNLTRKGLAFGALVALGASVFAGAPAFAADSVVLAADTTVDTTLAVPVTETFTLNGSLGVGSTADIAKLRFKVTQGGGTRSVRAVFTTTTVAGSASNGANTDISAADGSKYAAAPAVLPTSTTKNTLALSLLSAAADGSDSTQTVTVLGFLDQNTNGTYESGIDTVSSSVDIKFVKYSEVTTSTTITAPTAGNNKVTALVKFTNVNGQLLDAKKVGANFTSGTNGALSAADGTIAGDLATTGVVTTASAHGYSVGDVVTLGASSDNGAYQVTAVTDSTHYTLYKATAFTADSAVTTARTPVLRSGVAFSATKGGFSYTTSTLDTLLAKNTAVKVQPLFNSAVITTATSNSIGTAETASVVTRVLGSFTGSHVLSTSAASGTASGTTTAPASGTVTNAVAQNTEKKVYFLAKDTATPTSKALAGQKVTVTVTSDQTLGTTAASASLTVNGTAYTANTALPGYNGTVAELSLVTDADGKAFVTYSTANFTAGKIVTFVATSENSTATVIGTETARVYSKIDTGNSGANAAVTGRSYISNVEGDSLVTTDGAAANVEVSILDQWGGVPADNKFVVTATFDTTVGNGYVAQATAASTSTSSTFAAVTGGKAKLAITDNGTGKGTNLYILKLKSVAADGVLTDATDTVNTTVTYIANPLKVNIVDAADIAGGKIVLGRVISSTFTEYNLNAAETAYVVSTGSTPTIANGASGDKAQLTYSTFSSVDGRAIAVTAPSTTALNGSISTAADALDASNADAGQVTIAGTVASATTATHGGVAVPSALVTISGTNMLFSASQDGQTVWGAGTLTINADATGSYSFTAYSHVAGKNVVTVTSGTGTATLEAYYKDAVDISASSVTLKVGDGASQFQAGRALDVSVSVTDKYGNPVALDGTASTTAGKLVIAQTGSGYLSDVNTAGTTSATGAFTTKLITNFGDLGTSSITATVDFDNSGTLVDLAKTVSSEFGVTDADVTVGGRAVYASYEFAKGKTVTVSVDGKRLYSKLASSDAYTELKFTQKKAGKHVVTVRISGGIVYSESVVTTK